MSVVTTLSALKENSPQEFEVDGIDALAAVGAVAMPVVERPQTVEAAMAAGVEPLVRCGTRLARLVSLA